LRHNKTKLAEYEEPLISECEIVYEQESIATLSECTQMLAEMIVGAVVAMPSSSEEVLLAK